MYICAYTHNSMCAWYSPPPSLAAAHALLMQPMNIQMLIYTHTQMCVCVVFSPSITRCRTRIAKVTYIYMHIYAYCNVLPPHHAPSRRHMTYINMYVHI